MTVDPKHHRYFVARRGEVLRQIGDEFGGVIVSFPRSGVSSDQVCKDNLFHALAPTNSRLGILYGMADSKGRQIKILAVEIPDTFNALVGDWEVHETFDRFLTSLS